GSDIQLLQKALDRRHRSTITQFSKARDVEEVSAFWSNTVEKAEIPGGYWAVLTHPQSTEDLVCRVFGEVHMLSHLVGSANRADIRRLRDLELENAALQEKVARQQRQLRDAVVTRDKSITDLNEMLGKAIVSSQHVLSATAEREAAMVQQATSQLIGELRRRLASEVARREKTERRLGTLTAERDGERQRRRFAEEHQRELRQELELAERSLSANGPISDAKL